MVYTTRVPVLPMIYVAEDRSRTQDALTDWFAECCCQQLCDEYRHVHEKEVHKYLVIQVVVQVIPEQQVDQGLLAILIVSQH